MGTISFSQAAELRRNRDALNRQLGAVNKKLTSKKAESNLTQRGTMYGNLSDSERAARLNKLDGEIAKLESKAAGLESQIGKIDGKLSKYRKQKTGGAQPSF